MIPVSKKALRKLIKESRPRAGGWRCCTTARRRDETSINTSVSPQRKSENDQTEHSGCLLFAQRNNAPCRRTKSARANVLPRELIFFKRPGSLGCCCCGCSGDYKGPARHVARGSTTALKQKKSCGDASGAAREHSLHLDPPPPPQTRIVPPAPALAPLAASPRRRAKTC